MGVKLQHTDPDNYKASKVTVHYDNRIDHLAVLDDGTVEAMNQQQVEQLVENHGNFVKVDENEDAGHVLEDKTVDEVADYVSDMDDVERLKELREIEDRKTGKDVIDERLAELKEDQPEQQESEAEGSEGENDEISGKDEKEGEEAEDE